jgi:hypothetical protein
MIIPNLPEPILKLKMQEIRLRHLISMLEYILYNNFYVEFYRQPSRPRRCVLMETFSRFAGAHPGKRGFKQATLAGEESSRPPCRTDRLF